MAVAKRRYCASARLLAFAIGAVLLVGGEDAPDPEEEEIRPVAVVTHVENDVGEVPRSELARIFLKQQTVWPNGARCIPIDQRGDNAIRREFSRIVLRRSVYEVKRYWMQETMTGNARPPVSLESAATVKKYLQKLKGAVGYIYLDEVDDTVRILSVTDAEELARPPVEPEAGQEAGKGQTPEADGVQGPRDVTP